MRLWNELDSGQVSLPLVGSPGIGQIGRLFMAFNHLAGVVHLEALELLSKECESKVWLWPWYYSSCDCIQYVGF